ncbi:uncharacterized protein zgc:113149 [Antennarius striatus]|uniref:uncharacterized protein zgc:113149 n=1 Tax=Antennarius striatus TaxID=241820 RepID=UPI0035AFA3FF
MSGGGGDGIVAWRDDDEDFRAGGAKGGLRSKPRFSFTEVKMLLDAVKRNRCIILRKFNQGVSAETKKQTWAEITNQINGLGENHREVRQIMKKWADLKCDGKRRIIALRGPNGCNLRKKHLGPVEKMVHKILMMSHTGDGDSDQDFGDDDEFSKLHLKGPASNSSSYSYLDLTDATYPVGEGPCFDISPLSSPEKEFSGDPFNSSSEFDLAEDGERTMDCDEDSLFSCNPEALPPSTSTSLDVLPDGVLQRIKPAHTYSRNNNENPNHTSCRSPPGPSSSAASTSAVFPSTSDVDTSSSSAAPPPSKSPPFSNGTASSLPPVSSSSSVSASKFVAANDSHPAPPTSSILPLPAPSVLPVVTSAPSSSVSSSIYQKPAPPTPLGPSLKRPSTSGSNPSDPLPAGASPREQVAQMASQSLEQQRASRMLLTSVSHSLEALAQSVQLLVESQQEFVQESLLLQRETVDILRDFSNTAMAMLRDKSNSSQLATQHHHHHPASRF